MTQGAFVHNKQILDVVLVATKAVEDYRKRKKRGVIFKVDFEKVYDHVNWDFLDLVLEKKGFGVRWRTWMRGCISSANFSIMINEKPRGRFRASRGEEVVVSHLQFADDTLFLLDPDQINIQKVHTILNLFSMCSGLKINMNKSSLAGIHMEDEEVMALAVVVGCEKGSWPMKYIGLPLGGNPNSTEFWNPVVEKVGKRLDGWKKAVLSKGGKLTMIQSVLSSIPIYFMSLFKLPNGVAVLLEKMMRQFLWDREVGGKGKSLVDWKLVCTPKKCGGLGIGNLLIRNKALLGKWLWRFPLEQHTLWAAVIRSKYGLNREGWDTNLVTVGSFRNPWKFIAQGTSNFLLNTKWVVGRGDRILFWHHAWVESLVLKISFPRLFRLSNKQSCVVSQMVWNFNSGIFSCKSFFDCLTGYTGMVSFEPFCFIWKSSVPHRIKVFAWLVFHEKLNTCDRVQRKNPRMYLFSNRCVMCKKEAETADHLLLHCMTARYLWLKVLGEVGLYWVAPTSVKV
ncbi:hypothetical protein UlMin_021941 [Ulmus minor]